MRTTLGEIFPEQVESLSTLAERGAPLKIQLFEEGFGV